MFTGTRCRVGFVTLVAVAAFACDTRSHGESRPVIHAPDASAMSRFGRAIEREWRYTGTELQLTGTPFVPQYIQFSGGKIFIVNTDTGQRDSALYRVGLPADSSILLPVVRPPGRPQVFVIPFYLDVLNPRDPAVTWYLGITVTHGVPGDFGPSSLTDLSWQVGDRNSPLRPAQIDIVQGTARDLFPTDRKPAEWIVPR